MPTQTEVTDAEFLRQLFEYEYCEECGGDENDHRVITYTLGAYGGPYRFAQCVNQR